MKKLLLVLLVITMAVALVGCQSSVSYTETRTETHTDADGNKTTTTTVNDNGNVTTTTTTVTAEEAAAAASASDAPAAQEQAAEEKITATLSFVNRTGVDIATLHVSEPSSEQWGPDVLGEFAPLKDGETINFRDRFRYDKNAVLWDVKICAEDGSAVEFRGVDISRAADPNHIIIDLTYNSETQGYVATVR